MNWILIICSTQSFGYLQVQSWPVSAEKSNKFLSFALKWEWARRFPGGHFGCSYSASKLCVAKCSQMSKRNCAGWPPFQETVLGTCHLLLWREFCIVWWKGIGKCECTVSETWGKFLTFDTTSVLRFVTQQCSKDNASLSHCGCCVRRLVHRHSPSLYMTLFKTRILHCFQGTAPNSDN